MRTYSEFTAEHAGKFFWDCDAGNIDGSCCLDVLVYETAEDMDADTDNSLAVCRETVIDDRSSVVVHEGDQYIGRYSAETAPNDFLRELVLAAIEDGEAEAQDEEGCTVTAVRD